MLIGESADDVMICCQSTFTNFNTNREKFRVRNSIAVSKFHYETWALGISTVAAPMSDSNTLSEVSLKKFIWNNIFYIYCKSGKDVKKDKILKTA